MGEAENLVNNFNVENVIFNCGKLNELETRLIQMLEKKNILYHQCLKELNLNHQKIQFLNTEIYGDENEDSNVIYLNWQGRKLLFMGDANIKSEEYILENYDIRDITILKVGHHGSSTSSSEEFIESVSPTYALISAGVDNKFNHPHEEIIERLEENGSIIFNTQEDGMVMFDFTNNKIKTYT